MKKIMLMALCFLIIGSTTFALDIVIGAGGMFGYAWEKYHYDDGDDNYRYEVNAMTYGAFAFFGLSRYMEGSIAVYAGNNNAKYDDASESDWPSFQVGASLFFKYPFSLGNSLVLFPTIGANVQNNGGGLDLWAEGGVGLDIFFSEKIFLRGQGIYRFGFLNLIKGDIDKSLDGGFPSHGMLFKLGLGRMY